MKFLPPIILVLALSAPAVGAQEIELTVYNNDLALVKEQRGLELADGVQEFSFTGVPERLVPSSVHFRSLRDPDGTRVLEQNYRYDLLDRASLLKRYRGREVLAEVDGSWQTVRLLAHGTPAGDSQPLGRILEVDGAIHIEGFILPALPEGLLLEPSLVWLLDADTGGKHDVELSYLTEGVNWRADYVAVVGKDDALDLTGWVTLDNRSGKNYENARLKLVAGTVNRVQPRRPQQKFVMETMAAAPDAGRGFQEEAFFEHHLYTLGRPATVLDNEQKQVELLSAAGVDAERRYVLHSHLGQNDGEPRGVAVMLAFENSDEAGAGMPLPAGIVRVYQADKQGKLQFAGEDRLGHTPRDEEVRLRLGEAFDLRGEHKLVRQERLGDRSMRFEVEIELRNHKDEDVSIRLIEAVGYGNDWEVLRSNHRYERRSARELVFDVDVPADGKTTVTYELLTR